MYFTKTQGEKDGQNSFNKNFENKNTINLNNDVKSLNTKSNTIINNLNNHTHYISDHEKALYFSNN